MGGAHPYARDATFAETDSSDPDKFLDKFFRGLGIDPATIPPEITALNLQNDFAALRASRCVQRPDVSYGLKALDRPTLLYVGTEDRALPQVRYYVRVMPQARYIELPDLNHSASFRHSARILDQAREVLSL